MNAEKQNGYLLFSRIWDKDIVEISFKAPVKMRVINKKIAFTKGPITLAKDARLGEVNALIDIALRNGKTVRARRIKNDVFDSNIAFLLKTRDGEITLCDYAQAGKNYDDENSKITVWMDHK